MLQSKAHCVKYLNAFTLAEVLITLGIIGVVAALTIPILMNNIQNMQYKSAAKKAFSEIASVATQLTSENGGSLNGYFTTNDSYGAVVALSQKMQTSKICTHGSAVGTCWEDATIGWSYLNNTPYPSFAALTPASSGLILNSGTLFIIWDGYVANGCSDTSPCLSVVIDVNGFKKPNKEGLDVFWISLYTRATKPYDNSGTDDCIRTNAGLAGRGTMCLVKVLQGIDY